MSHVFSRMGEGSCVPTARTELGPRVQQRAAPRKEGLPVLKAPQGSVKPGQIQETHLPIQSGLP